MEFLVSFSNWLKLITLVLIEIILGIDNLIFVTVLTDKLPSKQRDKARLISFLLALIMRIILIYIISCIINATVPLFTIANFSFSGRDLIMLSGGIFLLVKVTNEIYGRLEKHYYTTKVKIKSYTNFWLVILQIVIIDEIFSLDSAITTVSIASRLSVTIFASTIATVIMLVISKFLIKLTDQYPIVTVSCLSFLLIIGINLIMKSFGFHISKNCTYVQLLSFLFSLDFLAKLLNIMKLNKVNLGIRL